MSRNIHLAPPDLDRLANIVREETGNQVLPKNFSMLENRIKTHVLKIGLSSISDYWRYFHQHEVQEREVIQSLMTTHHTFFFREYSHFESLDSWIEENISWLRARWERDRIPLKVWSAAASRGQEAYSIAMFLEQNLLSKYGIDYLVVGTDIDKECVAYAQNGVYPLKEVNTIPKRFLGSYWRMGTGAVKEFAAIGPALRTKTSFEPLNLFDFRSWRSGEKFDVVFCRNVFIYFSENDVRKVALEISERLHHPGLFVSGLSEPIRFSEWPMKAIGSNCYQFPPETQKTPLEIPSVPAHRVEAAPTKRRYRVLSVDDSSTIQSLLKKIFSQDPDCIGADTAADGIEASQKLAKGSYDLITLDIHMPQMNGIEFLEKCYQKRKHPPVIMISSVNRTDVDLATKAISLGAFDYVEKPAMNNLQKSTGEILTKVKMALRATPSEENQSVGFDGTVAQKIVIPDASQCLRVVFAGPSSIRLLENVVRGQAHEGRSPATVVIWADPLSQAGVENQALAWTTKVVLSLKADSKGLRPNHFYFGRPESMIGAAQNWGTKRLSIQVLGDTPLDLSWVKTDQVQILVEESLGTPTGISHSCRPFRISDVTPATSFPSLSAEFFAQLRKAAA